MNEEKIRSAEKQTTLSMACYHVNLMVTTKQRYREETQNITIKGETEQITMENH